MAEKLPTIGRIVHVNLPETVVSVNYGNSVVPAIVVAVQEKTLTLKVFYASNETPVYFNVIPAGEGVVAPSWFWPPREGE